MSSQVIDGWKPIRGVPGKTIVTQNSDGSYTVTIDPSAIGDGSGDMLKAVYDMDGNGSVDAAESVPWTGVTDKPLVFPPDAHTHDDRYYTESEIGTLLGGYVLKSTFDANTLLVANTDDTPVALSVGASTLVGRGAAGGIAALSASQVATIIQGSIDHGSIAGLTDDDHPQYIRHALADAAGDLLVASAADTFARYALSVPSSPTINFLGVANGETQPTWKSASSNPGAAAAILATNANGGLAIGTSTLVVDAVNSRVGIFKLVPDETLDVGGNIALGTSRFLYGRLADGTKQRIFGIGGDNIAYIGGIDVNTVEVRLRTAGQDRVTFKDSGNVGIGTTSPTISDGVGVDVNGKILRLRSSKTPSSASDTGNVGEICWDANYVNVAVGTDTWKKTPLVSAFAANSVIYADTSGVPANLTVGASTIVGRAASGGIAALSASDARTVLGLATTDTVQFAKIGVGVVPNFNLIFTTESSSVKSWLGGHGSGDYDAIAGFQYAGTTSQVEFLGIHSRGTIASPTATQSGDSLFLLSGKGYQGAAYTARRAYIRIFAEENYSSGAQGAGFAFATTAAGGTTRSEKIVFTGAGSIGVNTTSPTISDGVGVDINGKILRLRSSKTPASASATGNVGEICWDSGAIYVCVEKDTWKKATLATW